MSKTTGKQKDAGAVGSTRLVRRLTKALKTAIAIIRNDAHAREHYAPQTYATRMRWCRELEKESGLSAQKPNTKGEQRRLTLTIL